MASAIALIPARGGSKGIPRKNIRLLGGKPLIAHSIEHGLAATTVSRTVVSTDDEEIAQVALAAGAEVPFLRPAELAEDESLDVEVFRHALGWLLEHEGQVPELVVHLRPTCPIRDPRKIDEAVRLIEVHSDADALRSVSRPSQTPYKMWRQAGEYLEPLLTIEGTREPFNMPRQALPDVWWQNGYVDVVRSSTVLEQHSTTGARVLMFAIDDPIVEIDYEDGLERAERLLADPSMGRAEEPRVRHPG
jgi:CMP-N,N'-diacetyllegionaminic acid synthase